MDNQLPRLGYRGRYADWESLMDIHPDDPYAQRIVQWLNGYTQNLWNKLHLVPELPPPAPDDIVAGFLDLACKSQNTANITLGRHGLWSLPTEWTIDHIEQVVDHKIDLADEWEYRRLLEVYEKLDPDLLGRLVTRGLENTDPSINEAAREYQSTN